MAGAALSPSALLNDKALITSLIGETSRCPLSEPLLSSGLPPAGFPSPLLPSPVLPSSPDLSSLRESPDLASGLNSTSSSRLLPAREESLGLPLSGLLFSTS